jgi:hypothetical protein
VALMDYVVEDFRHAAALLRDHTAWLDIRSAIEAIDRLMIIDRQSQLVSIGRAPRGGQTVLNTLFEDLLPEPVWAHQPRLFASPELRKWKMDFLRANVGVEVSFNHAEAIPWQFTRLNIAGESERVIESSRIHVGVVITAMESLKSWSRMDSAVGTFDAFKAWLREMKPILPVPLLLIGLSADGWEPTGVFGGTRTGNRA